MSAIRRAGATLIGGAGLAAAILPMTAFAFFLADLGLPRTVDRGPAAPPTKALAIDLALLLSFAAVHSLLARPAAKRLVARLVPPALERSVYSIVAGLQVGALLLLWRPLPEAVWAPASGLARGLLWSGQIAGWVVVLASLAAVDTLHLFGWRQARAHAQGRPAPAVALALRGPYRFVRHPLYGGTILAMFSAPAMSRGRLLLAVVWTLYLLVGLRLEERDLERERGAAWTRYRDAVPPLLPRSGRARRAGARPASTAGS